MLKTSEDWRKILTQLIDKLTKSTKILNIDNGDNSNRIDNENDVSNGDDYPAHSISEQLLHGLHKIVL